MRQFNTLTGFLLSKSSNPTTNDTVEFKGYDATGDGGGAQWKHNGVTGQTASQSPTDLSDNLLNDASGNQWALIAGQTLNFSGTQWYPLPFGASGNGGYVFDSNGWGFVSLINDLSQTYIFDTVALMKSSNIVFPDGKKLTWQGYYTESDGGSNWGIVKSGAHTNDGGSVFTLDDGKYVQANLKGDKVNVKKWGARGNGVVTEDDSLFIQNACSYSTSTTERKRVYFPHGTYTTLNPIKLSTGSTLEGETRTTMIYRRGSNVSNEVVELSDGQDYTFNRVSTFNLVPFEGSECRFVNISSLSLHGESQEESSWVDAPSSSYCLYQNLEVRSFKTGYHSISNAKSFTNEFKDIRSNNMSVHFDMSNGPYMSFKNVYANGTTGAGDSGTGFRLGTAGGAGCPNAYFNNCPADTLLTAFHFRGETEVTLVATGSEARGRLIRAQDTAVVNVFGGNWSLTVIGSQADFLSAIFLAEDDSIINVTSAVVYLYDFTGGTINSANKKTAITYHNSSVNLTDVTTREDDLSGSTRALDVITSSGGQGGSVCVIEKGEVVKSIQTKTGSFVSADEAFPENQLQTVKSEMATGGAVHVIGTTMALGYGDSLNGTVSIDLCTKSSTGIVANGIIKATFAISSRNSDKAVIDIIANSVSATGSNTAVNITFNARYVTDHFEFTLTPTQTNISDMLIQASYKYKCYGGSALRANNFIS